MLKADFTVEIRTGKVQRELLEAIRRGMADTVDRGFQLSQELVTEQAFDQGVLLRSGHIVKLDELSYEIVYEAEHAAPVEFGANYTDKMPPLKVIHDWLRRRGAKPQNPEALGPIKGWLRKKGVIESVKGADADLWALAFFVAKDIKERGLTARPFMRPAAENMKQHAEKDVCKYVDKLERG